MTIAYSIIDEALDKIILEHLKQGLQDIDSTCPVPHFSYIPEEEKKLKKKLKKAFRVVIAWYSVGGNVEELLK